MSKDQFTFPHDICSTPNGSPNFSEAPYSNHLSTTLSQVIDTMDVAVWQLDMEYRIVAHNDKASGIYGDDIIGNYCYRLADQQNRVCLRCPAKQVYSGSTGASTIHEGEDANGNKFYTHHIAAPIRNEKGILTGVLVFIVGITNHRRVMVHRMGNTESQAAVVEQKTRALEKSETKFRDLYNNYKTHEALLRSLLTTSSEAMVIYDCKGHAKYLSPRFTEIFGWRREDLVDHKIPFVPPKELEDTHEKFVGPTDHDTPINHFKTKRLTKDTLVLDVDISVSKYIDDQNRPAWIRVTFNPGTTDKVQEMGLRQPETTEAIGRLAGGVARDLSRILKGIQANLTLMISGGDTHHPFSGHMAAIESHLQSVADLTQRLLGCAHAERPKTTTNLNALIDNSAAKFSGTQKEIIINKTMDARLWHADVDQQQIEQVLLSLFLNAAQAMPDGGNLFLLSENTVIDNDELHTIHVTPGKYIKISVTDTGVGMDQATLQKVFEPYFTTQKRGLGTGLGLSAAYGIVQRHGGTITVTSKMGLGSTFRVYLPAASIKPDMEPKAGPVFSPGQGTILLVDDEKMVRDVARPMLEKIGYSVLVAADGDEAIHIYERRSQDIQLVIIDMIMPEMNGGQVFDALKQRNPDVKVLLSSGYSVTGDAEEIIARGAKGFIQKPFGISAISKKIQMILDD